jgi:hypothetical protein
MILPPPAHALGTQTKERKQLSEIHQPFRLAALFAGKFLPAILAVEQFLQPGVDPGGNRNRSKSFGISNWISIARAMLPPGVNPLTTR